MGDNLHRIADDLDLLADDTTLRELLAADALAHVRPYLLFAEWCAREGRL